MPVSCCFLAASQCLLLMPLSCEHHLKQALPQPRTALPTHYPPPRLPALPAGYLQLDLVGAAAGATTTPIAKCLASVKVNLGSDCQVSLTPLSSGGCVFQYASAFTLYCVASHLLAAVCFRIHMHLLCILVTLHPPFSGGCVAWSGAFALYSVARPFLPHTFPGTPRPVCTHV